MRVKVSNNMYKLTFLLLIFCSITGCSINSTSNNSKENYLRAIIEKLGLKQKNYIFEIVKNDDISTYFKPDNYLIFSESLFKIGLTEDELAFILAHEIAHDILVHKMRIGNSKYSLDLEKEADKFGIKIMNLAGYDKNAAINALEKVNMLLLEGQMDNFEGRRLFLESVIMR